MTFRAAVAAALLAAAGFGCSEPPKSSPTRQARLVTPPRQLGQYTMTVTPMAEFGGRRARVDVVPDAQDGNPSTNPGGTVQVAGRFDATITPAGATGCTGSQSLAVPLVVTNFAAEQLVNVQVQVTSMSKTGFEVCKVGGGTVGTGLGNPALLPSPANTAPGAVLGLGDYGSLSGARVGATPVNDGSGPGGARSLTWWFKFPSNTPVSFTFVVWADPQQPEIVSSGPELEVGQPLTWTSAGSASTRLELCTTDPDLTASRCPAPATQLAAALGGGSFAVVPATTAGVTYWWRAVNTYSGGTATNVPANYASPWDSFTAVAPLVAAAPTIVAPIGAAFPADAIATATPILLQWNTDPVITDAVYQICAAPGPCPVPFDPLDPNAANLVWEAVEAWVAPSGAITTGYEVDVSGFLPTDPLTGDTWLLPGAYVWRVWNFDAANGVLVGTPSQSTFIVSPVLAVGPEIVSPLAGDQFPAVALALNAPILVQWITDPAVLDAQLRLCDTANCLPDPANGLTGELRVQQVIGAAPIAGAPNEYAVDVLFDLPTDPNTGFAWLLPGSYFVEVDNVVGGVAQGVPVTTSFQVVPSMPALPVKLGPADAASFLQNSLSSSNNPDGHPIPFTWTSVPEVLVTWIEVCATVDCLDPASPDPLNPLSTTIASIPVTGVPAASVADYAADAVVDALLFSDLGVAGGANGAYLETGTFYWRLYNEDPVSLAQLLPPGPASSFVVAPFVPGFAPAAGNVASSSAGAGTYHLGWTGHATLLASTVEVCADAACATVLNAFPAFDATPAGGTSTFSMEMLGLLPVDGGSGLPATGTYFWRVIDDDVFLAFPTEPPASFWTAMGAFTITP